MLPIPRTLALALALAGAACTRDPGKTAAAGPDAVAPRAPAGVAARAFPAPARPVAGIVTDTWSDEQTRDRAGEAETVMRLLEVRPGMQVADIGAGSGYYTVRLARRVGPQGRVYAEDIVPDYLRRLGSRLRRERIGNVTLVLGDPHDPRLPRGSVELALLVHMYHEVEQPFGLLHNLHPALRPGARVAVVDMDRPTGRHGTPVELLRCEMRAVGFREVAFHDLGRASGYLAVFEAPARIPAPSAIRPCPVP
ncbi:MAG TPA: methyltransferase domain-containing protein [Longimicrobiaceae bacterium]|nr:methyltransferase domain-containing protein [Longimicrobiaceae bacterium]